MWWESVNAIYGRTSNPYDTRRIAGGSSGGEAALISAAGSVIGIGSDIAGSIRMPSYFNGVFGFKPTPGFRSDFSSNAYRVYFLLRICGDVSKNDSRLITCIQGI